MIDIEDLGPMTKPILVENYGKLERYVELLIEAASSSSDISYDVLSRNIARKTHIFPPKAHLLHVYRQMLSKGQIEQSVVLEHMLKTKAMRQTSGVVVMTILSSPYPETGEHTTGFETHSGYNLFRVDETTGLISPDGQVEVHFHPTTGIVSYVTGEQSVEIRFKTPKGTKLERINTGNNISKFLNPQTGELRQSFSCPFDCYFCPSQPDMPKSYEDKEPAVARSLRYGWDPVLAMQDRFHQYQGMGITVDKIEIIVKGGTLTSYTNYYLESFFRDIFYSANTFSVSPRDRKTLYEEQTINETARYRIIGVTVETRPDYISDTDLVNFRRWGVTRVELGFQHTDDKILKKVNRQHTVKQAKEGIRQLLRCGFKVDLHLMPGLPGSTFEGDKKMVDIVMSDPDLRADQYKWYPTIVTPYTVINTWYQSRKYIPWVEDEKRLLELSLYFKTKLHHSMRTNRIQRDFTTEFINGGSSRSNLGSEVHKLLHQTGQRCMCIRCREPRDGEFDLSQGQLIARQFESSGGQEVFISYETNETIFGFLRLRFDPEAGNNVFPELRNRAMIRELHVYGAMTQVGDIGSVQHQGLGSRLMEKAKDIARDYGFKGLSVISGVGVRDYYRNKHGFVDGDSFLLFDF